MKTKKAKPVEESSEKKDPIVNEIKYFKTDELSPSKLNPRKNIDPESLKELSESIREIGIIHPLVVRHAHRTMEIICGDRRYRAAVMAQVKQIPCIVKVLTDSDAIDLMITENLQREDVCPLDEAEAFNTLIKKKRYDIPGLMARFGKSEFYVRTRLVLNDLIHDFRYLLREGVIGVGHAVELSKLKAEDQQELFDDTFSPEERYQEYWSCPTIKQLKGHIERDFSKQLSDASFDLNDPTLDKAAGTCVGCQKNTASTQSLFPDAPESGICLDRVCFKHKSDIHFDRTLKNILENEPDVVIGCNSYIYGEAEKKVKKMVKDGIPVVKIGWSEELREIEKPEPPDPEDYEDYEEDQEDGSVLYKEAFEEYENELREYEEKIAGQVQKVFIVEGNDKGKFIYAVPNSKADNPEPREKGLFGMSELKRKLKREDELLLEKVNTNAISTLREDAYTSQTGRLIDVEMVALLVEMLKTVNNDDLQDELFGHDGYIKNKEYYDVAPKLTEQQRVKVMRSFILSRLSTSAPVYNSSDARAIIDVARSFSPEKMRDFEEVQGQKTNKRKARLQEKIDELRKLVSNEIPEPVESDN